MLYVSKVSFGATPCRIAPAQAHGLADHARHVEYVQADSGVLPEAPCWPCNKIPVAAPCPVS